MRLRPSPLVPILFVLPLLVGCVGRPQVRTVIDAGVGGGPDGPGFSVGGFAYEVARVRGFATLATGGVPASRDPQYPEGTAAGLGDPRIGGDASAFGVAAGVTWAARLDAEGPRVGVFAGPALAARTRWSEYADATGALTFGQGAYWEREGSEAVLGLAVGVHWLGDRIALGLSYDSAVRLVALRIGWTPVL